MVDIVTYAGCHIQFIPKNKQESAREHLDKVLIELRVDDNPNYFLRAIDISNNYNKKELFNIQLEKRNIYRFGVSEKVPDEISYNNGTYLVTLKLETRESFHTALKTCFEQLESSDQASSSIDSGKSSRPKRPKNTSVSKTIDHANDVLIDIHKLSEYIQLGKAADAANLAEKLGETGAQLQSEMLDKAKSENIFPIKVQIDSLDPETTDYGKERCLHVYPSTKVHELQAIFEYAYDFPLKNQYFFVNGHLAYGELTMEDLKVQKNSLFVLFIIPTGKNTRL